MSQEVITGSRQTSVEEGIGNLHEFDRLKQNLLKEGLFNVENKKPLPKLPLRIGLITSPDGAAIEDFISVLERRVLKVKLCFRHHWYGHSTHNLQSSLIGCDLDKQVDVIVLTEAEFLETCGLLTMKI